MNFTHGQPVTPAQLADKLPLAAEALVEHTMLRGLSLEIWDDASRYHLKVYWGEFGDRLKSSYSSTLHAGVTSDKQLEKDSLSLLGFVVRYKLRG